MGRRGKCRGNRRKVLLVLKCLTYVHETGVSYFLGIVFKEKFSYIFL